MKGCSFECCLQRKWTARFEFSDELWLTLCQFHFIAVECNHCVISLFNIPSQFYWCKKRLRNVSMTWLGIFGPRVQWRHLKQFGQSLLAQHHPTWAKTRLMPTFTNVLTAQNEYIENSSKWRRKWTTHKGHFKFIHTSGMSVCVRGYDGDLMGITVKKQL